MERLCQPYILRLPIKLPTREEQSALVTFKNVHDSSYTQGIPNVDATSPQQELSEAQTQPEYNYDTNASWDPNSAWTDDTQSQVKAPAAAATGSWSSSGYNDSWNDGTENYGYTKSEVESDVQAPAPTTANNNNNNAATATTTVVQSNNDHYYKPR